MKTILLLVAPALVLSSLLPAQSGSLTLDPHGNYLPSYTRPDVKSQPGPDAPGDLLYTRFVSNNVPLSGYAPRNADGNLTNFDGGFWANTAGGIAEMCGYDHNGVLQVFPLITDIADSWPGYDGTRKTIICTNASDDTISGFADPSGAPIFRVSTPTPGPVGSAYDNFRDLYWYSDWTTNELIALDASDLHAGVATVRDRFSTAGQVTRIAGVAFDCLADSLITGGRDQGMQVAYSVGNKSVVASWSTQGVSVNDPQGCGLSAEGGVITTDFNDLETRVHEGLGGVRPGLTAVPTIGGARVYVTNWGSGESRAVIGWSNRSRGTVLKGVLTCLGPQARKAGVIQLSGGNPKRGFLNVNTTGSPLYFQAATLPSKRVTNVVALP